MHSQWQAPDASLRRHDLVFVSESAWRALMRARPDLASVHGVVGWVDRGWPLVARRPGPGDMPGIALGLPMPPSAGKRRLRIVVRPEDIVTVASPLTLNDARGSAPPDWQSTLAKVIDMAMRHGVQARVFGGLAWQALTGMDYLTASSDLDLLFPLRRDTDPHRLSTELDAIARLAPMRLDGELVRTDGAAVNWRELHTGADGLLVKTLDEVRLLPTGRFFAEEVMS